MDGKCVLGEEFAAAISTGMRSGVYHRFAPHKPRDAVYSPQPIMHTLDMPFYQIKLRGKTALVALPRPQTRGFTIDALFHKL